MSARSVTRSKVGIDYIDKYLDTMILNGQLQLINSTKTALYRFQGSEIIDSVNVILPVLSGDDTIAFQNTNNNFGGVQTFNQGIVTQGGLLVLPDPNQILEDDIIIADGLNLILGGSQGTAIGTSPTQMLSFFGVTPAVQPLAGGSQSAGTSSVNIFDLWDSAVTLGLLSGSLSSGFQDITESAQPSVNPPAGTRRLYADSTSHALGILDSAGVFHNLEAPPLAVTGGLPSQVGGRWGLFAPSGNDTSESRGIGLLSQGFSSTSGSTGSTWINNRPAMTMTSSSGSHNNAGLHSSSQVCTMTSDPTVVFKVAMNTNTNNALKLGLVSSTSTSDGFSAALNSSLHGVMIGYDYAATNYSVITNNGGSSQTNNTAGMPTLQTAGTAAIFKLAYNHTTPSVTWTIQTGPSTSTTGTITTGNFPSATTQMYLYFSCETGSSSSTNVLTIEDVEILLANDFNAF